jgi:acetyltransferase-like isoleucine patch superfamily enzyme
MKRSLQYLTSANLVGLVYGKLRLHRFGIFPYKNTRLRIHKSCQLIGNGRLHVGIQWEPGLHFPSQMMMLAGSKITLNGNFRIFSGHSIWLNPKSSLILGSGYMSNFLKLSCYERIEIGHNVAISENVTIRDSDDHSLNGNSYTKPVTIEDNVWIGINATILKGVTVGEGAVIAAGSVVTRDVPARSLVAGVPAVVKKTDIRWN